MSNLFKLSILAAFTVVFAACADEMEPLDSQTKTITVTFDEIAVRTTLNDAHTVLKWVSGDKVGYYTDGAAAISNAAVEYTEGVASYSLKVPVDAKEINAYYPYSSANTASHFSLGMSEAQTQAAAGVFNGSNYPMVATATIDKNNKASFKFAPVASIVAFNLYKTKGYNASEKVKSVTLTADNSQGYVEYNFASGFAAVPSGKRVTVTMNEPAPVGNAEPADKQVGNGQIYLTLHRSNYTKAVVEVETTLNTYTFLFDSSFPIDCTKDICVVNLDLSNSEAAPELSSAFSVSSTAKLASGVHHYVATHSATGISMDILQVDLKNPTVKMELGTGSVPGGKKTVLDHCKYYSGPGQRVVGAVNNDFFTNGSSDGSENGYGIINQSPCVGDGMFVAPNWNGYAMIAFDADNNVQIGKISKNWLGMYYYSGIPLSSGHCDVKAYNKKVIGSDDQCVIYNKYASVIPSKSGTVYVVATNWGVQCTVNNSANPDKFWVESVQQNTAPALSALADGMHIVIAFSGNYASSGLSLKAGDEFEIQQMFNISDGITIPNVVTAWGGIPRIVTGGAVDNTSINNCSEPGPTSNRPRTAVGYTSDKRYLYLIATEGESTTLKEEASIMIALGCTEAINCDGGGSTQMVTSKDGINFTNVSSANNNGGSYRAVINAALIVSTELP